MSLADELKSAIEKERKSQKWKRRPEVLLCANVPAPMHGVAPRVVLGSKWWNQTRNEAYESTDHHCVACGVHRSLARGRRMLEGHEIYKINYEKGMMRYVETVPLCHYCHNYIHDGRMRAMVEQGDMDPHVYMAILKHGNAVLREAGLERKTIGERDAEIRVLIANKQMAAWEKWRLFIGRKRFPPKFKTQQEWERAHKR